MAGDVEVDVCDFCKQVESVQRTYLKPSRHCLPDSLEERLNLYNQGDYFIIIKTCSECGIPEN